MNKTVSFPSWDREYAALRAQAGPKKGQLLRQDVYKSNSDIFHAGGYTCESGKIVELPVDDPMLAGTIFYKESIDANHIAISVEKTATSTVNDDCLKVAKDMIERGLKPCVMNLADAYVACGWYKKGHHGLLCFLRQCFLGVRVFLQCTQLLCGKILFLRPSCCYLVCFWLISGLKKEKA